MKISVVVNAYNRRQYIDRAVKSAEDACLEELQEYRNIFGKSVFSGGSAYSVPEKPHSKDDFKYRGLGE